MLQKLIRRLLGKPLREVIEKVGEQCQDALKNLIGIGKWLLIVLITIDVAISLTLYVADSENGAELFQRIVYKLMFYVVLIYFLLNWGDSVANFAKEIYNELFKIHGVMNIVSQPFSCRA